MPVPVQLSGTAQDAVPHRAADSDPDRARRGNAPYYFCVNYLEENHFARCL